MSDDKGTLPGEEWRDIAGQAGRYQVSNLGRVKSLARTRTCWNGQAVCQMSVRERILKPTAIGQGRHLAVSIRTDRKKQQTYYVHRLVLEAFVGPAPAGMECRHFPDRDPTNNRLNNLSWGTHTENMADRAAHGTSGKGSKWPANRVHSMKGKKRSPEFKAKVSAGLRLAYADGRRKQAIRTGRTWKHVV